MVLKRRRRRGAIPIVLLLMTWPLSACSESEEARRVPVPVQSDPAGFAEPVVTDLGYAVEIASMRAVIADLELTTEGETHTASLGQRLVSWVVPEAMAHPGHEAGGTVIGELPGRWVVELTGTQVLGEASMLEGDYDGANFSFGVGREDLDGLADDDDLTGHTLELNGIAVRGETTTTFQALVLQDDGRRVIGAPLDLSLDADAPPTLGLQARLADPFEDDTALDGIDFIALDTDGDGLVVISPDSGDPHNRLRNALQSHDHWLLGGQP